MIKNNFYLLINIISILIISGWLFSSSLIDLGIIHQEYEPYG